MTPSSTPSPSQVQKLLSQAHEADWSRRRDAGIALAGCSGQDAVAPVLLHLLLDPDDTGVTEGVTWALLREGGEPGLTLLARAAATASHDTVNWLAGPVAEYVSDIGSTGLLSGLNRLASSRDRDLAEGATEMLGWIEQP